MSKLIQFRLLCKYILSYSLDFALCCLDIMCISIRCCCLCWWGLCSRCCCTRRVWKQTSSTWSLLDKRHTLRWLWLFKQFGYSKRLYKCNWKYSLQFVQNQWDTMCRHSSKSRHLLSMRRGRKACCKCSFQWKGRGRYLRVRNS